MGPTGNKYAKGLGDDRPWMAEAAAAGFHEHAGPEPVTPEAQRWNGWGTALKPAWEPIIVARKPLVGTVAANVQAHGTGALNVDGCRIDTQGERIEPVYGGRKGPEHGGKYGNSGDYLSNVSPLGRWPANLVLSHTPDCREVGTRKVRTGVAVNRNRGETRPATVGNAPQRVLHEDQTYADADGTETVAAWDCAPDCPARMLDEQSGESKSSGGRIGNKAGGIAVPGGRYSAGDPGFGDTGGASRFFYTAKASAGERHYAGTNRHPTVKPVALMRWLVRLVTPPGGLVLDPFCGSGSTGVAALSEGFRFLGFELDEESVATSRRRIAGPLFVEAGA
jgi:hypothetical protein